LVRWLALRVPTAEPRAQQPRLERQPRGVVCAITIEGCKFITRGVVWAIAIEGCKFITRGVAAVPRRTASPQCPDVPLQSRAVSSSLVASPQCPDVPLQSRAVSSLLVASPQCPDVAAAALQGSRSPLAHIISNAHASFMPRTRALRCQGPTPALGQ
jgi:hypothetical protein